MNDFTIAGQDYKARRLPAMTEAHVTRRLAPVLNGMLPRLIEAVAMSEGGKVEVKTLDLREASAIAGDFLTFIAGMSDADATFVISECCIVTERRQGERWSPVWVRGAKSPQFDDIRFPVMAQIVFNVMREATADFMPSLGLGLSAEAEDPATSP